MRTVAHRGASALAAENTLRAVALAVDLGVDFVEVDVHLSRDGRLVVIHDPVVVAPPAVRAAVRDVDAAALGAIEVGGGERLPTLQAVLGLAAARIGVYVELKAPGTADALAALLGSMPRREQLELIAGSFDAGLVERLRAVAPDVERSVLFARPGLDGVVETCRAVGARYAHLCARPVPREAIDVLHQAALRVMTPHTNDPDEARRFRDDGADMIASDDPRLLDALRQSW